MSEFHNFHDQFLITIQNVRKSRTLTLNRDIRTIMSGNEYFFDIKINRAYGISHRLTPLLSINVKHISECRKFIDQLDDSRVTGHLLPFSAPLVATCWIYSKQNPEEKPMCTELMCVCLIHKLIEICDPLAEKDK